MPQTVTSTILKSLFFFIIATFIICESVLWVSNVQASTSNVFKLSAAVDKRTLETRDQEKDNVCTTKACYDWSAFLKSTLAKNYTKIDPCTNFATYACAGWKDTHGLEPDETRRSTGSDVEEETHKLLRRVIESAYEDKGYDKLGPYTGENATYDRENFEKMKAAYNACMDRDSIKKAGIKPLKELVSQLPGPETFGDSEGLTNAIVWSMKQNAAGLVDSYAFSDSKNPDVVTVWITSGTYMLPSKEYYDDNDTVKNYTKAMSGMFSAVLGGESEDYRGIAGNVIGLEAQIARADRTPEQKSDVTYSYNPVSLFEADELAPNISFTKIIEALVPQGYKTDTVINDSPHYFPKLATIMRNTTVEVIHAYFQWEVIQTWAYRIHEDFRKPLKDFNEWLDGLDPNSPEKRWKTCLDEIDNNLGWIESSFYVRYRFNETAKRTGEEMYEELRDVFNSRLNNGYDWIGESSKEAAKEKIANMVAMIGYPTKSPNVLDPGMLRQHYGPVDVVNDSYWENGIAFNKFNIEWSWSTLLKPADRFEWYDGYTVPTENAQYSPWTNTLAITAGSMQFPYFGSELPDHINYGATGATIGHEMTHGFDNDGREYDARGAYNNWWDNATRANFDKRAQCFVNQFSKYTVLGSDGEVTHVNGERTLTENIADAGGLSLGYEAWQKRSAGDKGNNKLLPGMEEFTPDQIFFLAFTSNWCYNVLPEQLVEWARTDEHAPPEYRIIGPMENSRGFKKAFNCPAQEPTCELW